MGPVYLDYAATCPVDPRVAAKMLPCLQQEVFGNSGSSHLYGKKAEEAVEWARACVGEALEAPSDRVIFTSGATEANNLAIKGAAQSIRVHSGHTHIVTVSTEHKAVLRCLDCLAEDGFSATIVPVDTDGVVSVEALERAIQPDTGLVSVMAANNETGVLAPLFVIGEVCRARGVVFHTDAVQAFCKVKIDVEEMGLDLVSLSGHKIYGPKGVGALWVHPKLEISPQIHGGDQECGLRAGTLNVPAIVGFGEAARIGQLEMDFECRRIEKLRDRLQRMLLCAIPHAYVHGAEAPRLPGHLSICMPGIDAKALLVELQDDLAASTVSTCNTDHTEPSHVLEAMGVSPEDAKSTLRLVVGRPTGDVDIEWVGRRIYETVRQDALRLAL